MVRVWVAGKTVCVAPCYTRAISERFRGLAYCMTKCYTNSRYFTLLYAVYFQKSIIILVLTRQ